MGSWLKILEGIIGAATVKLIADDLREAVTWSRKRVMLAAKKKLPSDVCERFSEEWDADILDKPGEIARLAWAIGCYYSTDGLVNLVQRKGSRTFSTTFAERVVSRASNIILSQALIIFLMPVMLVFAALVRRSGRIFDRTERIGRSGMQFRQLKYRTSLPAECGDENFTPEGLFLRSRSLDALPGIFNVFMGHMALIGPRPRTQKQFSQLRADYQAIYLRLRPGIISPLILLSKGDHTDAEHFEFEYFLQASKFSDLRIAFNAAISFFYSLR